MTCLNGVEPIYYNSGLEIGLAVEPYKVINQKILYDETRAFVVMEFPYFYYDEKSWIPVSQAFYRSSGHNSNEQFGDNINDKQAKGTWIPTNGLVTKPGYKQHGVCVLNNRGFIMKKPFLDDNKGILSRFHGDSQLGLISYLMGGGVWNVPGKIDELGKMLVKQGLEDFTQLFNPGCVGLTHNVVHSTPNEINSYIAESVSWNWHPKDFDFLKKSGLDKIDLNDEKLWIENRGRFFIPEQILLMPKVINNFINSKFKKKWGEKKTKSIIYGPPIINPYKKCPWEDISKQQFYKKL
jgi:hypothetical protein